jgi:hypothetical protein
MLMTNLKATMFVLVKSVGDQLKKRELRPKMFKSLAHKEH